VYGTKVALRRVNDLQLFETCESLEYTVIDDFNSIVTQVTETQNI